MIEVKFHRGNSEIYSVSLEDFKKATNEEYPFLQINKTGKSAYAICPLCENTVKLLGVYAPLKSQQAHARHVKRNIDGMPLYEEYSYLHCPNHRKRGDYVFEVRDDAEMTDFNREILGLAHDYFDKCLYIIKKYTGLIISDTLAEKIAKDYMAHPGFMTYDITRENVPYIMALCMTGIKLMKRIIVEDSPIYNMLVDKAEVNLVPLTKKEKDASQLYRIDSKSGYLGISFIITGYRFVAGETSKLREFINLHIGIPDGKGTYETYAEEEIEVDSFLFNKLIYSKNALKPRAETVEIADRILVIN